MPKIEIKLSIWSDKGFSERVYISEVIITKPETKKFVKEHLIKAISFISSAMKEYNQGKRGTRWFELT